MRRLIGYLTNLQAYYRTDSSGSQVFDANGRPVFVHPDLAFYNRNLRMSELAKLIRLPVYMNTDDDDPNHPTVTITMQADLAGIDGFPDCANGQTYTLRRAIGVGIAAAGGGSLS